jgi:prevent-host-death family protein
LFVTYARPVRDLRNNYNEIIELANAGNRVIITQNGREAAVIIGTEAYKEYEDYLYHQYVSQKLAESKEEAKDPNTKWLSEEEFWMPFRDDLEQRAEETNEIPSKIYAEIKQSC